MNEQQKSTPKAQVVNHNGNHNSGQESKIDFVRAHPPVTSSPVATDEELPPKRKLFPNPFRWGVLLLVLVALGGTLLPRFLSNLPSNPGNNAASQRKSPSAFPVQTTVLQSVSGFEIERSYAGEIVAKRSSELGFEQSGTVTEIWVNEGERVEKGQILTRLDTRALRAEVNNLLAQKDEALAQLQELTAGPRTEEIRAAQAAIADLEQQITLSQLQLQRRQYLYEQGAIAQETVDEETFNLRSLESRLEQAQSRLDELQAGTREEQIDAQSARVRQLDAQLQSLEVQLSKSLIRAPFNGKVSQRFVDEGVIVQGGQPVLRLIAEDSLEARIGVPISASQTLTVGSEQQIKVGEQFVPARISAILPELDSSSRTVTVVLTLSPEARVEQDFLVGQTAHLSLTKRQNIQGFWLPSTALVATESGLWSVYVVQAADHSAPDQDKPTAVSRQVELIHTSGDRVLVSGMLREGETVIVSGVHRVVPGQEIQPSSSIVSP